MTARLLRTAERLYRRRDFAALIRLLEPQIYRYRENQRFYFLIGIACLHTGDVGGAYSYLLRADQLQRTVASTLGLAAIHCRRGEVEQALTLWLQVLDSDGRNGPARRGLAVTRKGANVVEFARSAAFGRLLPPLPVRWGIPFVVLCGVLAGVAAIAWGPVALSGLQQRLQREEPRPQVAQVDLAVAALGYVATDATAHFQLTDTQVQATFELAKRHLQQLRDNQARVEINRILYSNATTAVKERARQLQAFIVVPDFSTMADSYSYRQVASDPRLYDGVYVRWSGKVANLSIGAEAISFDFLVGYQDERVLEGQTMVVLDFAALLRNGMPLEILGQVERGADRFQVHGISIHELAPAGA